MHLTERRLTKIEPILQRYRQQLIDTGEFYAHGLEQDLKATLNAGYTGLKDLVEDLLKNDDYRLVAAWYMQNSNHGGGIVSEFKAPLAKLYGVKSYDHAKDLDDRRSEFWERELKELRADALTDD